MQVLNLQLDSNDANKLVNILTKDFSVDQIRFPKNVGLGVKLYF